MTCARRFLIPAAFTAVIMFAGGTGGAPARRLPPDPGWGPPIDATAQLRAGMIPW